MRRDSTRRSAPVRGESQERARLPAPPLKLGRSCPTSTCMMGLLDALLGRTTESAPPVSTAAEHQIAAAALLIEAASVDGGFSEHERQRIERLLAERFGLGAADARELVAHAEAEAGTDWHGYTRVLKENYDHDGRIAVVEMLWEIVLADGTVHDYEASLMRRVPALLYVADRENAEARARAASRLERRGSKPGPWSG
jgi:uncharacterized tellurite resistance protein B-like protein